ncbi:hypothetical protein [Pukyongiella litopenaei]|uniref:Uncharacterized protein n=1 Tax=Pukyongiella litopenaei TaxID=2605946 RepID=A0A2S0MRD6_9RHOB|nr:hypothetical protein [Pukyongiella litopenaei]AVO38459.1 hypothetical protein C6Y53_12695 [Pukyongiella litopenaei]
MNPASEQKPRALLVVGTGHSGTSLTMQALQKLGAYVPDHTVPPSEANQRGTGEDTRIRDLMNGVWRALGDFITFRPGGWRENTDVHKAQAALATYLQEETRRANGRLLAIEFPLAAVFLPLWQRAAETVGVELRFVWATRDILETLHSFDMACGTRSDLAQARCLQRQYYTLRDAPDDTVILPFERWRSDPHGALSQLAGLAGLPEPEAQGDEVFHAKLDRATAEPIEVSNVLVDLSDRIAQSGDKTLRAGDLKDARLMLSLAKAMRESRFFQNEYGPEGKMKASPEDSDMMLRLSAVQETLKGEDAADELAEIMNALRAEADRTAQTAAPQTGGNGEVDQKVQFALQGLDQLTRGLQQELQNARKTMTRMQTDIQQLQARNRSLAEENRTQKAEHDKTLRDERAKHRDALQAAKADAATNRDAYRTLTEAYDNLETRLEARFKARLTQAEIQITDLNRRTENMKKQVEREAKQAQRQAAQAHRKALDQIYQSRSWRITAPIRAVTGRFRPGSGGG